ncbi:DUF4034 domain-containing protein [Chitinimonas sp. JJ19]|uniref:DUF4034 domain-containing protein n=1 Tax=Chitinimonas sp. JJ19 TaxID=3109352 RepID=UPI0030023C56
MKRIATVLIAVVLSLIFQSSRAGEYLKPTFVEQKKYEQLLLEKKFGELDKAAREAIRQNLMTSEGLPVLDAIYTGTAGCVARQCQYHGSADYWINKKKLLVAWKAHSPKSITAKIANAMYFLEFGWGMRGAGHASSVTDEQWQLFHESIEKAKLELLAVRSVGANDPGWYSAMLLVALAQGWESSDFDKVYSEATTKFPTYIPFYFTAANYHSERWYGSRAEFDLYVQRAAQQTNQRLGDSLYARLNWLLSSNSMFANGQAEWPRMRKGFERIVRDYPDAWNLNNFGKFACMAGDARILPAIMKKIGGAPIISAWNSQRYYESCLAFADGVDPDFVDNVSF